MQRVWQDNSVFASNKRDVTHHAFMLFVVEMFCRMGERKTLGDENKAQDKRNGQCANVIMYRFDPHDVTT